jgi:hypothetical protein
MHSTSIKTICILSAGITIATAWIFYPWVLRGDVSRESFERIKLGMTQRDVVVILGRPKKEGAIEYFCRTPIHDLRVWSGQEERPTVYVGFGANGRVLEKRYDSMDARNFTIIVYRDTDGLMDRYVMGNIESLPRCAARTIGTIAAPFGYGPVIAAAGCVRGVTDIEWWLVEQDAISGP